MGESPTSGAQPKRLTGLEIVEGVADFVCEGGAAEGLAGEHGDRDPWGCFKFPVGLDA